MRKLDQYLIMGGIVLSWLGFFLIGWFVASLFHSPERTVHIVVTATPNPAIPTAAPVPNPIPPTIGAPYPESPSPTIPTPGGGQLPSQPSPPPGTNQPGGAFPPAIEPTITIPRSPTDQGTGNTGTITNKTSMREEPELFGEELATLCEGDTVEFIDEQKNLLTHWYKVEVTELADNCLDGEDGQQPARLIRGYRGWITSGNVSEPAQAIQTAIPFTMASPTPLTGFAQYTIEQTVTAFKRAGLEAENIIPMTTADFIHMPEQPIAGIRFFIPSAGQGIGGKILAFETLRELEAVRTYYNELGQSDPMFSSRIFVNQNLILQLDRDVPDNQAALYERALNNINNQFGLDGIAAEVAGQSPDTAPPPLSPAPTTPTPSSLTSPTVPPATPDTSPIATIDTTNLPEAPLSFRGEASQITEPFSVTEPYNRLEAQHTGSHTFTIYATDEETQEKSTLVDTTGAYQGSSVLLGPKVYSLEIYADGKWTMDIEPLSVNQETAQEVSGQGDMVSDMFQPPGSDPIMYRITHGGDGLFRLNVHCADSRFVVQESTGQVDTEAPVDFTQGPCLWDIRANGVWRIEAQP